jgi:hypothetical protein
MKGGDPLAMLGEGHGSPSSMLKEFQYQDGTLSLTLGDNHYFLGKRGILHLILWTSSLKMGLVMFDPHVKASP